MAPTSVLIEVCVDSVESAIAAIDGGAHRLELCSNLGVGGGTTPSLGLFKAVRQASPDAPMMVMVRPRIGDFCYTQCEIDVMHNDIQVFKQAGATGVVFGILTADGEVDVISTARLAKEAFPMEVCFHRAFDMTRDAAAAYRAISSISHVTRILTSGHGPVAAGSVDVLCKLLRDAKSGRSTGAPAILVGSGVNATTVHPLLNTLVPLGLGEIHLSGATWISGAMKYRKEGMDMGAGGDGEWGIWRTSRERVREVRRITDEFWSDSHNTAGGDVS
ncbi:hypothetical protein WOLCODRAFT_135585 [Wolfiporia cocos MD-104 SS10]|uniref:Copper homeostasis protein cutC homolog n=1 Tax=Wolfiporia cocos (strain MD-104) TaxID=742152 RepID=A0A2H3J387_WOLCO|nr:hypothetical protein WOLCODRAFT_135585 [Wolfiporia cocos MD-104 SS10]